MTSSISAPNLSGGDDVTDDAPPALDPKTFDLSAWIGGVTGTVRAVTLYQRPDLVAQVDELQRQLRIAEAIPEDDRGMGDATPEGIRRQLEQVAQEFESSALVFKVQGRSDDAREKIAKKLKKQGVTEPYEVALHQLADAIIEPSGVTVDFLRVLGDRSEAQLKKLNAASLAASLVAPQVDVPFSNGSSDSRRRDRSS